jgi:DNA-binding ferritin-like protein
VASPPPEPRISKILKAALSKWMHAASQSVPIRKHRRISLQLTPSEAAVTDALAHVLGNTLCLSLATQAFSWNLKGPGAGALRRTLRTQHRDLLSAMEPVVDLIRASGLDVLADDSDRLVPRERRLLLCMAGRVELLQTLIDAQRSMMASVEAAIEVARSAEDEAVVSALGLQLLMHRRQLAALVAELHPGG